MAAASRQVPVSLPRELWARLEARAAAEGTTVEALVRRAVAADLRSIPELPPSPRSTPPRRRRP